MDIIIAYYVGIHNSLLKKIESGEYKSGLSQSEKAYLIIYYGASCRISGRPEKLNFDLLFNGLKISAYNLKIILAEIIKNISSVFPDQDSAIDKLFKDQSLYDNLN